MTAGSVSAPLIIPMMHLERETKPQKKKKKSHIDTCTPVALHSDTPGVVIFYSVDGSKPTATNNNNNSSSNHGNQTRKYTEPILLHAGKVSVRAVAITSDGRESSIVTKVFLVEPINYEKRREEENGGEENILSSSTNQEVNQEVISRPEPQRIVGNAVSSSSSSSSTYPTYSAAYSGPRFLKSRLDPTVNIESVPAGVLKSSSDTMTRIQRETDYLRCVQCLDFRPSDPLARFCPQCGSELPPLPRQPQRLPPSEGGQMIFCVYCKSEVPINTHSCLICEASIQNQLHPQYRLQMDQQVCVCCGRWNPAQTSSCLTCENRLKPVQRVLNSAPSGRKVNCAKCKRLNRADCRFCDWCGAKSTPTASYVMCWRCGASSDPFALHCAACGVFLEAPPTSSSDIIAQVKGGVANNQASPQTSHDASGVKLTPPSPNQALNRKLAPPTSSPSANRKTASLSPNRKSVPKMDDVIPVPRNKPAKTVDRSTQTVGLYFPSATGLQKKEELQKELQKSLNQSENRERDRERQPLLTAVSPGRGFWRKQCDHVCFHFRSFCQNTSSFRALLGEPRMGRLVSAVLQEDPHEVSLTVCFTNAAQNQACPAEGSVAIIKPTVPNESLSLSSVTERATDTINMRNDASTGVMKKKLNLKPKPAVADVQLLKELEGRGEICVIQQLLDQGADPCCCDKDGRPALLVAVSNQHHDIIPLLVQRGANVNLLSGRMQTSSLHAAASLGEQGVKSAEMLLSCKASVCVRNASGQTPYDSAVSTGSDVMVSLLARQTGRKLLDTLKTHKQL